MRLTGNRQMQVSDYDMRIIEVAVSLRASGNQSDVSCRCEAWSYGFCHACCLWYNNPAHVRGHLALTISILNGF